MNVVALAGGVGGAKLADGLKRALAPENLTVVVNTGDDFDFLGLHICPDLDTVCYTLAEQANMLTGWGRSDETWNAFESLAALGGPDWFHLGDRDLGLHLERTRRLVEGQTLSEITCQFCEALGVGPRVIPMSNDPVPTLVSTDEGVLAFQEYFVRRRCQPQVTGFEFHGVGEAHPAPGVLEALQAAERVIICPSNPWVSIGPILAVPGIREALQGRMVIAVSPIIGGQAVKGPAAKMFSELGIQPSALAVARQYAELLSGFVLDRVDEAQAPSINKLGIRSLVTDTLMTSVEERFRLAQEVLNL